MMRNKFRSPGTGFSLRRAARRAVALTLMALFISAQGTVGALPGKNPGPILKERPTTGTILALYKSTENDTPQTSLAGRYAEAPLRDLGYDVVYWDIAKSFPDESVLQKCKGILTWYRTAIMPRSLEYVRWLTKQIKAGKKVVVLGNFGAHSDDGKTWLTNEDLNEFFYYLGVEYKAAYTGKTEILEVEKKDPSVVEAEIPLKPEELVYYLLFRSSNPENKPYLVLKRKDLPEGSSAMILRTPFGGMAQEHYLYKALPENKVAWRLSRKDFFKECFTYAPKIAVLPQKKILGLYKSSEGVDERSNDIRRFAFQPLHDLGYEIQLQDIDKGLPSEEETGKVSAVMTWFRGATMTNAPDYYDWLIRQIKNGKKIIILSNFGAFQDRVEYKGLTLTRWASKEEYNDFLSPFGLEFEGQWTNKRELLKVIHKDPAMVEYQIPLKDEDVKHFFLLRSSSKETTPYLLVEKTDTGGKSNIIAKTPGGGFALESYLYTQDPKTWQMYWRLNLPRFLSECLSYQAAPRVVELLPPDPTLMEIPREAESHLKRFPGFTKSDIPDGKKEYKARVLALFKSSEKRFEDVNPIHSRLEVILNHLGLRIRHHDIESGLPDDAFMEDYIGILSWDESPLITDPEAYCNWLIHQMEKGKKVVILGTFGGSQDKSTRFTIPKAREVFEAMGLRLLPESAREPVHLGADLLPRSAAGEKMALLWHDPEMTAFETPLKISKIQNITNVVSLLPENKVYCRVKNPGFGEVHPVCVTPYGAVAMGDFVYREVAEKSETIGPAQPEKVRKGEKETEQIGIAPGFWQVNPFRFLSEAFGISKGFSLIDLSRFSSEFVYDDVLTKYPLPIGISYVTMDFERNVGKYYNKVLAIGRSILSLYNTEPATHTFSHPFSWRVGDLAVLATDPKVTMERRPTDNVKEIVYSINFINKYLCPPGKKLETLYWSGNCFPNAEQIALVEKMGCRNLNGGDPVFDSDHRSYSHLCGLTSQVGNKVQVYTSGSNDFIYTDGWTKNFGNMAKLTDHFEHTESPRRVMPINIYLHFYIGDRREGIEGLKKAYDYVMQVPHLSPLFPSEYIHMVHDFLTARFFETGNGGWTVLNSGDLRTIRFDSEKLFPDFGRSVGVIGYMQLNGSLYVHLDDALTHTIYLTENKPSLPYLRYGSHFVSNWRKSQDTVTFELYGTGRGSYEIGNLSPEKSYQVKLKRIKPKEEDVKTEIVKADAAGTISFRCDLDAYKNTYRVEVVQK
ncbi:MAG: hypothetical protein HYU64_02180 [Armatimonadetes bacterium]|nr:hypothetical protein [Armatimonadota bacterium]